ncbi:unnamed protein product [Anisakis simplex]|uniref:UPAR/Ly6 domain-containing protein n=1 Tax=Anisakis simplex TaxID=6269 RepID=A0A0M3J3V4_ANISI|nr:unnamed protein product [Anisakis simplex]
MSLNKRMSPGYIILLAVLCVGSTCAITCYDDTKGGSLTSCPSNNPYCLWMYGQSIVNGSWVEMRSCYDPEMLDFCNNVDIPEGYHVKMRLRNVDGSLLTVICCNDHAPGCNRGTSPEIPQSTSTRGTTPKSVQSTTTNGIKPMSTANVLLHLICFASLLLISNTHF